MKKIKFLGLGAIILALNSCTCQKLTYDIQAKSDTQTGGSVTFYQKGEVVTMKVKATNLTPGEHAIHLHDKADCSAPDGMSTGGHWNPTSQDHGKWGHGDYHRGDIGNLVADEKGNAKLSFKTDLWCIGCEDQTKNILNHSVIIHAGVDDFHTQPTGDAGGRVGCVEIK